MVYTASYGWGPGNTPKTIYRIVTITAVLSIFCAFVHNLFLYFGIQGPQTWLSLSWTGLGHWYLWQPITYLFIQAGGENGISFGFLFALAFNMYMLWIMGASTLEKVGNGPFLRFYFICGILTGICTLLLMPLIGQYISLAGATPIILSILMIWTMLHPESDLLLFFIFPIKAKYLLPTILIFLLLINLSQLNFIELIFNFMGLLIGYLYATIIWELKTPYEFTGFTDKWLVGIGQTLKSLTNKFEAARPMPDKKAEIIDFHTGKSVLDDDLFMDSVLDKISKHGEKSLTWRERNRMKKISEKKSRQKH